MDPDDEPDGGTDGLPMCGECARNRDESADFDESGLGDGEIDRVIDDSCRYDRRRVAGLRAVRYAAG